MVISNNKSAKYKKMYIVEALLEYIIVLLVNGAFLAKLTSELGFSDSLTGKLNAFISLGAAFQLLSFLFIRRRKVKGLCLVLQSAALLCFSLLYLLPGTPYKPDTKTLIFVCVLCLGYLLQNSVAAPKTNWLMAHVEADKKGIFTANKEIISLLGGMLVTFIAGRVSDRMTENGQTTRLYTVFAVFLVILTVLHALSVIKVPEKENIGALQRTKLKSIFTNPAVLKICLMSVIWNAAYYVTGSFMGTYQIKELGFSLTFVSVTGIMYSLVRISVSRKLGRLADRASFAKMLTICFSVMAAAFFINIFTAPSNGKVLYPLYYILTAVAMAGINGGCVNIVFECVEKECTTITLALQSVLGGVAGFGMSCIGGVVVERLQNNGNTLFGFPIYAQQLLSAFSFILFTVTAIYSGSVLTKLKKSR